MFVEKKEVKVGLLDNMTQNQLNELQKILDSSVAADEARGDIG